MANITTWSPDTCKCKIDIEGNDWENPKSVKSLIKCEHHKLVADGQAHLDAVWKGECQIKNFTFPILEANIAGIKIEDYDWYFDSNRVLRVAFKSVNPTGIEKTLCQAQCDSQFGSGKVIIN